MQIKKILLGALTILAAVVASLGANAQAGGGAPGPAAQGGGQGGQRVAGAPPAANAARKPGHFRRQTNRGKIHLRRWARGGLTRAPVDAAAARHGKLRPDRA